MDPYNQPPQDPNKIPSAFTLFGPSSEAVRLNFWTFVCLYLYQAPIWAGAIILSISLGQGADNATISVPFLVLGLGLIVAGIVSTAVAAPATIITQLRSVNGQKVTATDAIQAGLPYVWRLLGLRIIQGLVYMVGLILLIVPFFIFLRRYTLAPYYLIDRNLGIRESFSKSAEESKVYRGAVWGFIGVMVLVSLVGCVPLGFVAAIVYFCAAPVRYLQIKHAIGAENSSPATSTTPHLDPPHDVVQ